MTSYSGKILSVIINLYRAVRGNFLRGTRDICFWRSANDKHSAPNCARISSVDFLLEIDVGNGLNCAKVYSNDLFFCENRAFTALDFEKCMLGLQSWQSAITFHNFLRGRLCASFRKLWNVSVGCICMRTPLHLYEFSFIWRKRNIVKTKRFSTVLRRNKSFSVIIRIADKIVVFFINYILK